MKHEEVTSGNIKSIGYDDKTQTMEVRFLTGDLYKFESIPVVCHMQLMSARSKGQYFSKYVRNNPAFKCTKIAETSPQEQVNALSKPITENHTQLKNVGIIPQDRLDKAQNK